MMNQDRGNKMGARKSRDREGAIELGWLYEVLRHRQWGQEDEPDPTIAEVTFRQPAPDAGQRGAPIGQSTGTKVGGVNPAEAPKKKTQGTEMIEHDRLTGAEHAGSGRGMTVTRYYTTEGLDPYASVQ